MSDTSPHTEFRSRIEVVTRRGRSSSRSETITAAVSPGRAARNALRTIAKRRRAMSTAGSSVGKSSGGPHHYVAACRGTFPVRCRPRSVSGARRRHRTHRGDERGRDEATVERGPEDRRRVLPRQRPGRSPRPDARPRNADRVGPAIPRRPGSPAVTMTARRPEASASAARRARSAKTSWPGSASATTSVASVSGFSRWATCPMKSGWPTTRSARPSRSAARAVTSPP